MNIQKILDENASLIQTIQEFQFAGKPSECMSYQMALHRNLQVPSHVNHGMAEPGEPHQNNPHGSPNLVFGGMQRAGQQKQQQQVSGAAIPHVPNAQIPKQGTCGQSVVMGGPAGATDAAAPMPPSSPQQGLVSQQYPGAGATVCATGVPGLGAQQQQQQPASHPLPSQTSVQHSRYPDCPPPNQATYSSAQTGYAPYISPSAATEPQGYHHAGVPPAGSDGAQGSPVQGGSPYPVVVNEAGGAPGATVSGAGLGAYQQAPPPGASNAQQQVGHWPPGQPPMQHSPGRPLPPMPHGYPGYPGAGAMAGAGPNPGPYGHPAPGGQNSDYSAIPITIITIPGDIASGVGNPAQPSTQQQQQSQHGRPPVSSYQPCAVGTLVPGQQQQQQQEAQQLFAPPPVPQSQYPTAQTGYLLYP
uniref:SS18 N-terminal domain-containing protein n=1 Tax=Anopheles dirus TaxID=7168 RepID=A0A182NFJ8_9DIPT